MALRALLLAPVPRRAEPLLEQGIAKVLAGEAAPYDNVGSGCPAFGIYEAGLQSSCWYLAQTGKSLHSRRMAVWINSTRNV